MQFHADKVLIGIIMLLIPGIMLTNSIRDILLGDIISGSLRLVEAILMAATLALGMMAAIWLMGGIFRMIQGFFRSCSVLPLVRSVLD